MEKGMHFLTVIFACCLCACADNSQRSCEDGWFGFKCQYKCRCSRPCSNGGSCTSNCNKTDGSCLGDGRCQGGWFGPACQYADLAYKTTSYKNLTDGNDETCSLISLVTVELDDLYYITWLRITFANNYGGPAEDLQLEFSSLHNSPKQCSDSQRSWVSETTLDIHCSIRLEVKNVILNLRKERGICSLYISGGRNVAIKQNTTQSSDYTDRSFSYTSDLAVDGDTRNEFADKTCTHTEQRETPVWRLYLSQPRLVHRYVLHNRIEKEYRLKGFTLWGENSLNEMSSSYKDDQLEAQLKYIVMPSSFKQIITNVVISVNNSEKLLTLCEVEIYGDSACRFGLYGRDCEKQCNCAKHRETCFVSTGGCPSGCAPGYQGEECQTACTSNRYGKNCSLTCSQYCAEIVSRYATSTCHHVTGHCLNNCKDGFAGDKCENTCQNGKYGQGCQSTCSRNCVQIWPYRTCHYEDGTCVRGCEDGWEGFNCTQACISNRYGKNCSLTCSQYCAEIVSINPTSTCHHVTGHCLNKCKDGFTGDKCENACNYGKYGPGCRLNCSPNCARLGADYCYHTDGHCLRGCKEGWVGKNCTKACDKNKFGPGCNSTCSLNCVQNTNNGTTCNHINGNCLLGCQVGFQGERCERVCTRGMFGGNCTFSCSSLCAGRNDSRENWCHHVNGSCLLGCEPGFEGDNCTVACELRQYGRECRSECSKNCAWKTPGARPCDHIDGRCLEGCNVGWQGTNCTKAAEQLQASYDPYNNVIIGAVVVSVSAVFINVLILTIIFCRRRACSTAKEGRGVYVNEIELKQGKKWRNEHDIPDDYETPEANTYSTIEED